MQEKATKESNMEINIDCPNANSLNDKISLLIIKKITNREITSLLNIKKHIIIKNEINKTKEKLKIILKYGDILELKETQKSDLEKIFEERILEKISKS